ncbi:hypothetical protein O1611_g2364 [Lasiodiplodia mahajangana]|uniref:Uncharacterized protein n=1 Tax=Lasiodiplodia mahajangana TaxID=1108764 RepID=A0ACC2JVG9_9PEZI|nr:hypothetical protein O1611_g2364 [Lasiodiplodia mahajangana]
MFSQSDNTLLRFRKKITILVEKNDELHVEIKETQYALTTARIQEEIYLRNFRNLILGCEFQQLTNIIALAKPPRGRKRVFLVLFRGFNFLSSKSWVETDAIRQVQNGVSQLQTLDFGLKEIIKETETRGVKAADLVSRALQQEDACSFLEADISRDMKVLIELFIQDYETCLEEARESVLKVESDSKVEREKAEHHEHKMLKYRKVRSAFILAIVHDILIPAVKVSKATRYIPVVVQLMSRKARKHSEKQLYARYRYEVFQRDSEAKKTRANELEAKAKEEVHRLLSDTLKATTDCQNCAMDAAQLKQEAKEVVDGYSILNVHISKLVTVLAPFAELEFKDSADWQEFRVRAKDCLEHIPPGLREGKEIKHIRTLFLERFSAD